MAYRKVDFNRLVGVLSSGDNISNTNCAPGGSGNTNFDEIIVGTGRTLKYQEVSGKGVARAIVPNGQADDGNIQMRYYCSGQTALATVVEMGPNPDPNAQARSIELSTPLGYAARMEIAVDGTVMVYTPGTGSNNDMVGTSQVDTVEGWRIWFEATLGPDGAQTVRAVLFNGSDGKSLTPTDTLLSTTATTRNGTTFDQVRYGVINNAGEATLDFRNIQLEDASLGDLGPLLDAPTISGTPNEYLEVDLSTVISGGAGAPFAIDSVTQTGGTPVTNLSHDDSALTFRMLRSSVVDTCTFSVVMSDSSSTPASAFNVVVEPAEGGIGGPYILTASGQWV